MLMVANSRKRATNPLLVDPTRTATLRAKFMADMAGRWRRVQTALNKLIDEEDAFGLATTAIPGLRINTRFRFLTDPEKVGAFEQWFKQAVDSNVLTMDGTAGDPWTADYVHSAYKQGMVRAYVDTKAAAGKLTDGDFYEGGKDQFLLDAFAAPEAVSKMKLVGTRAFEQLKGVSNHMGQQLNITLAQELANGTGPREVARMLSKKMTSITKARALTIARTEIIHAHAEGQLDSFERLGVKELGVMVEWQTAHDANVCPRCRPLEGVILSVDEARGMIPRHPNCRCAWLPANVGEKTTGQKWSKDSLTDAFKESLKAESPKAPDALVARALSRWVGADVKILGKAHLKPSPKRLAEIAAKNQTTVEALIAADVEAQAAEAAALAHHKEVVAYKNSLIKYSQFHEDDFTSLPNGDPALNLGGMQRYGLKVHELPPDYTPPAHWLDAGDVLKQTAVMDDEAPAIANALFAKKKAEEAAEKAKVAHAIKTKKGTAKGNLKKKFGLVDADFMDTPNGPVLGPSGMDAVAKAKGYTSAAHMPGAADLLAAGDDIVKQKDVLFKIKVAPPVAPAAAVPGAGGTVADTAFFARLQHVRDLPGSTRPKLMLDPVTGESWVVKAGGDPGHIRSEALADKLYRIMDVTVPDSQIIETAEGPVKVSRFLDGGRTLSEYGNKPGGVRDSIKVKLQKDFVADALLGNWDVVGLSEDNIMVISPGRWHRIDNGGALMYRAQGAIKTDFGKVVNELDTMRDAARNKQTAKWFGDISENEINQQIRRIVGKRDEILAAIDDQGLRTVMAGRIKYLESRLPPVAAGRPAEAARRAVYTLDETAVVRIKESKINGTTLSGDRGLIEDNNVLVWEEIGLGGPTRQGPPVTRMQFKLTKEGNELLQDTIAPHVTNATTGRTVAASPTSHPEDVYWEPFIKMIKTVNAHAGDGAYNQATVTNFNNALIKMAADTKVPKALVKQYTEMAADINKAYANKTATVGKYSQWVEPPPKVAKAATSKVQKTGGPFRSAVRKDGHVVTRTTQIKNGEAQTISQQEFVRGTHYKIDVDDGFEIQWTPPDDQKLRALHGTVEVTLEGPVSVAQIDRVRATMAQMGIDIAPATAEYEEIMYIHRTAYLRNMHTSVRYMEAFRDTGNDTQRLERMRKWAKGEGWIGPGHPEYNPHGFARLGNGSGPRIWNRIDLTEQNIDEALEDVHLIHYTGGLSNSIPKKLANSLDRVLNTGGEFLSTTSRIRKGIDMSTAAGASSHADVASGGADYFFTRLIPKRDINSHDKYGFVFKKRLLNRADHVSYDTDHYGNTTLFSGRQSTVGGYRANMRDSGNETIFKMGLSVMDDLEYVVCETREQVAEVLAVFKKHGIEKLNDGRYVRDVVVTKIP